jgi:glucose/arabinose dehydrogenase
MKISILLTLTCLLFCAASSRDTAPTAPTLQVSLQLVTDQLDLPTAMAAANDGSNRLFVLEQVGRVRLIQNGKLMPQDVLDLTSEVVKRQGYDERGLLGIALHPNFAKNKKFYLYFSAKTPTSGQNHKSVIAEYTIENDKLSVANPQSGRVVMEFDQPEGNHNGGDLAFGPDGYLYIASGDGGGAGDRHGSTGNGQDLSNLLGKILRVDVDVAKGYGIPKDNPFVDTPNARPEIYAYGLRNPWRISFDPQSKRLYTGDVGQNIYEEVDIVIKGGNYGWRQMEGFHTFKDGKKSSVMLDPIAEYPHTEGISITGGYVYRGKKIGALAGKYIFGDYIGPTWYLSENTNGTWSRGELNIKDRPENWQIYSFGQDQANELYVLAVVPQTPNKGMLYRLKE